MAPKGWCSLKIGEVLERVVNPVRVDPTRTYHEIGIRSHGRGIFYKPSIQGTDLGNKRVFWVEPDCFIVNIVFAWEQAVARTTSRDSGKIASHRFPMYRPRDSRCDVDFITSFFKSALGKHLLSLASPGGAGRNKTLGQNSFEKLEILLPDLSVQQKIVATLNTWDRAIEVTERLILNSQTKKRAIVQQLCTGKVRLTGFSKPWRKLKLAQLGTFKKGKGIRRDELVDQGLPCVLYGDIYTRHNDFIREFSSYTTSEVARTSERISSGDLLFAGSGETAADIGKCVAFVDDFEAYAGGDIVILSVKNDDSKFLGYLMNSASVIEQKARFGQGNSVVHISATNLRRISISLPDLEEQKAIASVLEKVDDEISNLSRQLSCLKSEKRALMQQLLTGKRRVRPLEAANG